MAAKGKRVETFDLDTIAVDDPAFQKAVLGPTGNLRAPAVKRGKTWLVGFHEDAYDAEF